jgi:hypothetical protein
MESKPVYCRDILRAMAVPYYIGLTGEIKYTSKSKYIYIYE